MVGSGFNIDTPEGPTGFPYLNESNILGSLPRPFQDVEVDKMNRTALSSARAEADDGDDKDVGDEAAEADGAQDSAEAQEKATKPKRLGRPPKKTTETLTPSREPPPYSQPLTRAAAGSLLAQQSSVELQFRISQQLSDLAAIMIDGFASIASLLGNNSWTPPAGRTASPFVGSPAFAKLVSTRVSLPTNEARKKREGPELRALPHSDSLIDPTLLCVDSQEGRAPTAGSSTGPGTVSGQTASRLSAPYFPTIQGPHGQSPLSRPSLSAEEPDEECVPCSQSGLFLLVSACEFRFPTASRFYTVHAFDSQCVSWFPLRSCCCFSSASGC